MSARIRRRETAGVLGGTFDPVHLGHLHIAEEARRLLGLAHTLLLPAAVPPHKSPAVLSPARHREAMVRLAIEGREGLSISTLELVPARVCYTIDSLRRLRVESDYEPLFILGLDALAQINSWHGWREILDEFDLAVIARSEGHGAATAELAAEVAARLVDVTAATPAQLRAGSRGGRIFCLPITPIAVSSSTVRARARAGLDMSDLVPLAVARYIHDMGLYRGEERH